MTGRELIIYILKNNLEDTEVFSEGFSPLFITPEEAAKKWECGPATIKTLIDMKKIKGFKYENIYYVLADQLNPFQKGWCKYERNIIGCVCYNRQYLPVWRNYGSYISSEKNVDTLFIKTEKYKE